MSCCNAPTYLAITYHKENQLIKVTEVMCTYCNHIKSVYQAQLDRNKKVTAELAPDSDLKLTNNKEKEAF